MSWIFIALFTPVLYALSNFLDKFLLEKRIKNPFLITILMGFVAIIFGLIVLFIKGFPPFTLTELIVVFISGVLLNFYLFPYYKALSLDDASRVIPLYSFVPIFTLLFSYIFLGDKLTLRELLGFAIILSGGFLLSAEKMHKGIFTLRKSLWLMIIASCFYAISSILFKFVLLHHDVNAAFGYQNIGIGIGSLLAMLYSPLRHALFAQVKQLRPNTWALVSLNELFSLVAQYAFSYAITIAPVALVTVVGETQPFFVLIFGILLTWLAPHIIKEDINKKTIGKKLFSIVIIFIGIYLLTT